MDVRIRAITADEFEVYGQTLDTAFGQHLTPDELERERSVAEVERCLAAFDGDEMVGGASAVSFTMTVPGAEVATAAVTGVGVKPTHRRRGINSALMRRQLDDVHAGGESVAALYASEGAIYGRFGYAMASYRCLMDIERERTSFVRGFRPSGRVRLVDRPQALPAFLDVYDEVRRARPGMMALDDRWMAYRFDEHHNGDERRLFYAVHASEGAVDGYAVYHVKHDWHQERRNELAVEEVQALSPQAYAELWRYLFDVDLMDRITAWNRPLDEPLLLLLREPERLRLRLADGLWVRLVDVPTALQARGYASAGRLVIRVADAFCPWNEGTYELESGPGGTVCRRTDAEPQLALTVNELGACYLGGIGFRQLARAGRVDQLEPGALDRADAMFAWDPAPWCPFVF